MKQDIAYKYAKAFFECAKEEDLQSVMTDLVVIRDVVMGAGKVILSPFVTNDILTFLKTVLDKAGLGIKNSIAQTFIELIASRKKFSIFSDIVDRFEAIANESMNIVKTVVVTAIPLNQEQVNLISDNFSTKLNKKVIVNNIIDPEILGGMVIRFDSQSLIIDNSIANKIRTIGQSLTQEIMRSCSN